MRDWQEMPLNRLASFQKGRRVDTSPFQREGFLRYLGASGLAGGDDGYANEQFAVIAKCSDTLMLWDGERSGLVGYGQEGIVASTVSKLSPSGAVHPKYLYFALASQFDWIQHRRTGTGVPHVPKDLGRILKLRVPQSMRVQERIATVLSCIDTAIEKTEALLAKHQRIKAGLMHELFTRGVLPNGKLRPTLEQASEMYWCSPLGWIPSEWRVVALGDRLKEPPKNGFSPREVDSWQGAYVLGLGCLTHDGFMPKQLKLAPKTAAFASGAMLSDGDFLISRANTPELVGLCGRYKDIGSPTIYPDLMMRLRLADGIYSEFLELQLNLPATRRRLTSLAVGTSSSMAKLNAKSLEKFSVLVPPPNEQRAIADRIAPLIEVIESETANLDKLRQQKQGLMQDLLTGRVSVGHLVPELANA